MNGKLNYQFPKHRTFVEATGSTYIGVNKLGTITVFNEAAEDIACGLRMLQIATEEEVSKIQKRSLETGLVSDVLSLLKTDKLEKGVDPEYRLALQKCLLLCSEPSEVVAAYDNPDTFIYAEADSADQIAKLFESLSDIGNAQFMLVVPNNSELLPVLKTASEELKWKANSHVTKGAILFSNYDLPVTTDALCKAWTGSVSPVFKGYRNTESQRTKVRKVSFAPFKTMSELMQAVYSAINTYTTEGAFGMYSPPHYYEEADPAVLIFPSVYIEELEVDNVIVCVNYYDKEKNNWVYKNFRIPIAFTDSGEVELTLPGVEVVGQKVFTAVDETIAIVPAGTEAPMDATMDENMSEEEKAKRKPCAKSQAMTRILKKELSSKVDEQYVLGIVLEPNDGTDGSLKPDTQGDVYSAATIRQSAHKWMSEYNNLGIMHEELTGRRAIPVESYLCPEEFVAEDGTTVLKGSWLLAAKIEDPDLWALIKANKLTGWSIGGYADREVV